VIACRYEPMNMPVRPPSNMLGLMLLMLALKSAPV
jgi:hypothetical protein